MERLAPEHHDTVEGVPEPAENPALVGHAEEIGFLLRAYSAGRLPQGIILSGPKGIGKATLAFHLTRHLLAYPDPNTAPADLTELPLDSTIFRQVASGAHPSVLHLTRPFDEKAKRYRSVLSVSEIRRVGKLLSHTSHDGGQRVVIVDAADDMNAEAANGLLKNLEEPPARTMFILIAHVGGLLPTLRSRCQILRLSALGDEDALAALSAVGEPAPAGDNRAALLRAAKGSVRQAIMLIRQGGLDVVASLDRILASQSMNSSAALKLAENVSGKNSDLAWNLFRDQAWEYLTRSAAEIARAGRLGPANRIAQIWQGLKQADQIADAYNLDRRQHALEIIEQTHRAVRGS